MGDLSGEHTEGSLRDCSKHSQAVEGCMAAWTRYMLVAHEQLRSHRIVSSVKRAQNRGCESHAFLAPVGILMAFVDPNAISDLIAGRLIHRENFATPYAMPCSVLLKKAAAFPILS